MEVIIFEKEAYQRMMQELMRQVKEAIREAKKEAQLEMDPSHDWVDAKEAMRLLGCKKSKLQELRDTLSIRFSQHGRTIKYSKKSILAFLEKNVQKW